MFFARALSDESIRLLPENEEPSLVVSALGRPVNYNEDLVNVKDAWKVSRGGGVKVVVLDTGVPRHRDISVAGWKSFVRGYDFDLAGHGTGVGSVIAGTGRSGAGITGIAPDCEDWYGVVMNEFGVGTIGAIADGIRWAVDEVGADIVNMSLGIPGKVGCDSRLVSACEYAYSRGVTLVAAAGNDAAEVNCPALLDTVIAVGAVDRKLRHADFSSYGPEVEFAAGGVDVTIAYNGNGYATMSGTSFSAPVISGIAALIVSKHRAAGEEMSPESVREHLTRLSKDIGDEGRDDYTGYGIPVFFNRGNSKESRCPKCRNFLCRALSWLSDAFFRLWSRHCAGE